ncbi:ATP-binding protein [Streptomyces purpurogeneiscleroticus]|uniref:ATP-binding protein n=1 Tax=Streptomyces purpurogeneiscleroticus TaxID=68259 RepID=UPI001CBC4B6F|nr:ATP-binding protein [Streptomyces purpurogeneiscleroticus]
MNEDHFRERFYPRTRRSVPAAREFARRALADWSFGEARTQDALLCVSELATNAVRHGVPPGRGFLLRLHRAGEEDHLVRIEVHDSGPGCPRVADPAGDGDERGRGLLLVGAVADKWGVADRNPGKIVWCEVASRVHTAVCSMHVCDNAHHGHLAD